MEFSPIELMFDVLLGSLRKYWRKCGILNPHLFQEVCKQYCFLWMSETYPHFSDYFFCFLDKLAPLKKLINSLKSMKEKNPLLGIEPKLFLI
jgi:hypothetical protein